MSKYSKIMTMRNGGKMEIKTASVGLFAKLVSLGMGLKKM
jgi:hypothetical protein